MRRVYPWSANCLSSFSVRASANPFRQQTRSSVLSNTEAKEAYKVLGVESGSDFKNVRAKYLQLAKENHPDVASGSSGGSKGKSTDTTHATMASINEAYSKIDQHFKAGGKAPAAARGMSGTGYGPGGTTTSGRSAAYPPGGAGAGTGGNYNFDGSYEFGGAYDGTFATQQDEEFFSGFMDPREAANFAGAFGGGAGFGGPSGFDEYMQDDGPGEMGGRKWADYFKQPPGGAGGRYSSPYRNFETEQDEQEAADAYFKAMNHGFSNDYHSNSSGRVRKPFTVSRSAGQKKKEKQQQQARVKQAAAAAAAAKKKQEADGSSSSSSSTSDSSSTSSNNAGSTGTNTANAAEGSNGDPDYSNYSYTSTSSSKARSFKPWSEAERNALANMYSEGKSFEFIANALGKEKTEVLDEYNNVLHMANADGGGGGSRRGGSQKKKRYKGFGYINAEGDLDDEVPPGFSPEDGEYVMGPDGKVYMTQRSGPGRHGGGRGRGRQGMGYTVNLDLDSEDFSGFPPGMRPGGVHFDDGEEDEAFGSADEFFDVEDIALDNEFDEDDENISYHRPGSHSMHGGRAGGGYHQPQAKYGGPKKGGAGKPHNQNRKKKLFKPKGSKGGGRGSGSYNRR